MTEEEARQKWCPFARCGDTAGCNRNGSEFELKPYCIASDCMAWRWWDTLSDDGTGVHMVPTAHRPRHPLNDPNFPRPLEERWGYCGLAGKP